MIIKLKVRTNKIESNNSNILRKSEFIIFDNCTEIRYGKAKDCDLQEFNKACPITLTDIREFPNPPTFDGNNITNIRWMVKNPVYCSENETYHYNTIEWKDRETKEYHRLVYDTLLFICDDKGSTLEKVIG